MGCSSLPDRRFSCLPFSKPPKFPLHWEKISHEWGAAVKSAPPQNFPRVGGLREILRFLAKFAHTHLPAPVQAFRLSASSGLAFSPAFGHGLCAVAAVTQALQIAAVRELLPVSVVRLDVVNVCRSDSAALPCALAAPRLTQQLCRPQVVRPDRQAVPATPPAALCAAPCAVLGSVLVTVPAPHQLPAAGMQARPQRLTCHTRACRAGQLRCWQ